MHYKKSKRILDEIKKTERILLNCHRGPDPDSIGSALAMYDVLSEMNKEITIICPSEEIFKPVSFLKNFNKIKSNTDFSKFDFSEYDLLISLDSSSFDMVTNIKGYNLPKLFIINIDHHTTNELYGNINLVDKKSTSVGEIIYLLLEDWGVEIDKDLADCILTAIIGDTGAFRFPNVKALTFRIAAELMDRGANKDYIISQIYRSEPLELIRFYGEVLSQIHFDKKFKFVWAAIPYSVYSKLNPPVLSRESTSSLFAQVVEGTDFGFVAVEQEPNRLSISFRSRTGLDTSKMAKELGGGGHIYASGAMIEGLPFKKAVAKVLLVAKKYAKNKISK